MAMEFSDWITEKFIKWRGDRFGKGSSVAEFAKSFGAPQSLMSEWMKKGGKVPTSKKYVDALIAVYGDEARQILKVPPSHVEFDPESIPLESLPPPIRTRFKKAINEYEAELNRRKLDSTSPEAPEILIMVFARHGIKLAEIENNDL